jgi:hypothetical protein
MLPLSAGGGADGRVQSWRCRSPRGPLPRAAALGEDAAAAGSRGRRPADWVRAAAVSGAFSAAQGATGGKGRERPTAAGLIGRIIACCKDIRIDSPAPKGRNAVSSFMLRLFVVGGVCCKLASNNTELCITLERLTHTSQQQLPRLARVALTDPPVSQA